MGLCPPVLTNLNALRILDLGTNALGGPIAVLGGMPAAASDRSQGEPIRRGVPGTLGNLPFLNRLDLSFNRFTGVQAGLGNAPVLDDIDLSNNRLGGFSAAFTRIFTLTELDLSFNLMTGEIPNAIITLPELESLDVSNNRLNDLDIPNFKVRGPDLEELLLTGHSSACKPGALALYDYVKARDPLWDNCGTGRPPPPPPGP